jgi:hypothetical protein
MSSYCSPLTEGFCRLATALGIVLAVVGCSGSSLVEPSSGTSSSPASAAKPPQKGTLRRWPEATSYLRVNLDTQPATVELGPARPSGMDAFWSIASTKGAGSGFFYSDRVRGTDETRVAAAGVPRVQDIHDASIFDYSPASVGPVPVGGIVLVHHLPTNRYLALVLDAIEPVDPKTAGAGPYAYADVTWYLAEDGAVDFSAAF